MPTEWTAGLAMAGMGVFVALFAFWAHRVDTAGFDWPVVEGKALQVTAEEFAHSGSRKSRTVQAWRPRAEYEYIVGGREYRASRITFPGLPAHPATGRGRRTRRSRTCTTARSPCTTIRGIQPRPI